MSVSSIEVVVVFVFFFFKQCQGISSRRISWLSFANLLLWSRLCVMLADITRRKDREGLVRQFSQFIHPGK